MFVSFWPCRFKMRSFIRLKPVLGLSLMQQKSHIWIILDYLRLFRGYQSINHTPTVLENAFTNVTRTGSRRWWLWWQKYARVRSFSSPSVSPSCTCRKQARDFYCIQCCGAGGAAIRLRLHLLKTNKICQHWIDINIFKFSLVF